jgi:DNA-binding NarL/FixJ family response regulator
MPRRENPIDPAGDALAKFALQLRALRRTAGQPPYREMAKTVQVHYSATALSKAANGRRRPTWHCVEAYLRACHVTDIRLIKQWRHRWEAVRDATGRGSGTSDSESVAPTTLITSDGLTGADQRSHLSGRAELPDVTAGNPGTSERDHATNDQPALSSRRAAVASLWSPGTPDDNPASRQAPIRVTRQEHDPIRIMLVVRTSLLRGGLAAILSSEDDLEVVAEASNLEQALPVARAILPTAIVIDLLTEDDLYEVPQFGDALPDCSLLVLAGFDTSPQVNAVIDTRIAAVIAKETEPRQLCQIIRRVAKGERVIDPTLVDALRRPWNPPTPRELARAPITTTIQGLTQIADMAAPTLRVTTRAESHSQSHMLLGRSRELTQLNDLLLAAKQGHSAAIVISGAAGIGKSALAESMASTVADTAVLRTRGIEAESAIPFAGLADLLRPVQHLLPELPEPQAAALTGALAPGSPTTVDRFAVAAATLSLLAVAAQGGSLLCVVDDAHWLDESSAEALVFAACRMRAEGSVLVFTVRDNEPGAGRFSVLEQVRLGGLDAESATALLERGAGRPLPPQVVGRLLADTGGNPLALLELPAQLTEDQLSGQSPILGPLPLSALLREGFLRQVRRLPPRSHTALLLVATSDLEATGLVERALQQAGGSLADLEPAEAAGLVSMGNGRLAFRHPLIRPAVYHAASPAERRVAHRQLALALDSVAVPQAQERRAWHLAAAAVAPDEEVAAALERVGTAANHRSSYGIAIRAFERAAGLSPSRAERARRLVAAAMAAVPAGLVQEAIHLLEEVRIWTDDPTVAAVAECDQHRLAVWGVTPEASRARLFDFAARLEGHLPEVAARAYLAAAQASMPSYDIPAITTGIERAARLAGSDEHVALYCDVLAAITAAQTGAADRADELLRGRHAQLATEDTFDLDQLVTTSATCYLALERTAEARPLITRAVEASRRANAAGLLAHQLPWMAMLEWLEGNWTSALALAHEAVELASQTGWLAQLPNSLSILAKIEAGFGMASCREHADQAVAAAQAGGHAGTAVHAPAAVGLLELGLDLPHDAAKALQDAWDAAGPQAPPNLQLQILPDLVEAYVQAGLLDRATEKLALLDDLAARTGRLSARAAAARCHGLLERRDFAEQFEQALRWHSEGTPPFDRARTHLAYGARLHRSRNKAAARDQLHSALELFERLGAAPWAQRTRTKLVSSGGSVPAHGDIIELRLTPQELQVSLAIQRGLTNADAATALFLSVKTIEYHLSNIYRKLGINSRTQLIRILSENRPAQSPQLASAPEPERSAGR